MSHLSRTDLFLLRTVRRLGRNPRYRALENTLCKWFLILFAAVIGTHIILAVAHSLGW